MPVSGSGGHRPNAGGVERPTIPGRDFTAAEPDQILITAGLAGSVGGDAHSRAHLTSADRRRRPFPGDSLRASRRAEKLQFATRLRRSLGAQVNPRGGGRFAVGELESPHRTPNRAHFSGSSRDPFFRMLSAQWVVRPLPVLARAGSPAISRRVRKISAAALQVATSPRPPTGDHAQAAPPEGGQGSLGRSGPYLTRPAASMADRWAWGVPFPSPPHPPDAHDREAKDEARGAGARDGQFSPEPDVSGPFRVGYGGGVRLWEWVAGDPADSKPEDVSVAAKGCGGGTWASAPCGIPSRSGR